MNTQSQINKLLFAIREKGKELKMNTVQFYSEEKGRYCTKYILYTVRKKDEESFYSPIRVLKYLADMYKELGDNNG